MEYRREIDGLRAIAVIPVILFHAGFQAFSGGYAGVDIFFVISGYLITSIILAEKSAGVFTIIKFYERRARRILPALFVVIIFCLPFAWFCLSASDMMEFAESTLAVSTFTSNIFFWRVTGYFDSATELKPLLHTWSLAVEEQYYVFFPLFILVTWRLGRRWLLVILAIAAIASLVLAEWASVAKPAAAFFLLPMRSWEILVGAFIAFYFSIISQPVFRRKVSNEIVSATGLFMICVAIFSFDDSSAFPGLYALVPTIGAAFVILAATPQTLTGKFLSNRLFVGVGLISYSAYLWHQPLLAFARYIGGEGLNSQLLIPVMLFVFPLAYFTWKYVEIPFRDKTQFSRKEIFVYGGCLSLLFIFFGIVGHLSNGFLFRYPLDDQYLAALRKSDQGRYVESRFNQLSMIDFDGADKRKKVLVIGDSFAQDLVNAVYESEMSSQIQLSTRHISAWCGNLFIERSSFASHIERKMARTCANSGLFEDEKLRGLMSSADEIWFASSWMFWQAELISDSVSNVKKYFAKPVKVFGKKNFGKVDIKLLLSQPVDIRLASKGNVEVDIIRTNALLKSSLQPDSYIDTARLMCGDIVDTCAQFDESGYLISYDGNHLTKFGAKYFGVNLNKYLGY